MLAGDGAEGVLRRLRAIAAGDVYRERRVFRRLIREVRCQADAGDGVHQVAEVDALVVGRAGEGADGRAALGPLKKRLGAPLVGHLEGVRHVALQPLHQSAQGFVGLCGVGVLGVAGGRGGQLQGGGVSPERGAEVLVHAGEAEEQLVGLLLVLEARRLERLQEVQVEIPRRHGGGAFVGRAEEQIAVARRLALRPGELVLPDLEAGDVRFVQTLQQPLERLEVVAVELGGVQAFGALFDEGVEIVGLLQVQVELAVLRVRGDELAAHRAVDLAQHGFHLREQVVRRVAAQLLHAGLVQAEAVAQFLRGGAEGRVDVALGEAMHGQRVDQPQRHRLVGRAGERLLHARLQHFTAIDHGFDVRRGAEGRIAGEVRPIAVVGDEARVFGGNVRVQQPFHGVGQRAQRLALLRRRHLLEGVDVHGVYGEQANVLVQAFVQALVEPAERRQVLAYPLLLPRRLAQQALGHDELHVALGDDDLREAVLHAAHGVRGEAQARAVEDGLLHAGHEAQAQILAGFADLAQEVQIQDELLIAACAQIVEQFVHHQQQALLREGAVEGRHHVLEAALVSDHFVAGGELVGHALVRQAFLQLAGKDVPQRHGGGADLRAHHLELAGDRLRRLRGTAVAQAGRQFAVLRQRRDDGHQVRLAGAVVAHHQQPLVVRRPLELQVREGQMRQPFRHFVGHHEGLHQPAGVLGAIRVAQLHHGLDGLELDQLAVFHGAWSPVSTVTISRSPAGYWRCSGCPGTA